MTLLMFLLLRPAVFVQLLQLHLEKGKLAIWRGRQPASRLPLCLSCSQRTEVRAELQRLEFEVLQDVQVGKRRLMLFFMNGFHRQASNPSFL